MIARKLRNKIRHNFCSMLPERSYAFSMCNLGLNTIRNHFSPDLCFEITENCSPALCLVLLTSKSYTVMKLCTHNQSLKHHQSLKQFPGNQSLKHRPVAPVFNTRPVPGNQSLKHRPAAPVFNTHTQFQEISL